MEEAEKILDQFVEGLFRLIIDHHRMHVVEMELTLTQAQALSLLRAAPVSTSGLAAVLGISAPAVTQLTARLVRKQLIERRTVDIDRRSVMVALTEKGNRAVDRFRLRRNEVFAEALSRLSNQDRAEVIDALSKVTAALGGVQSGQSVPKTAQQQPRTRQKRARTAVDPAQASNEVVNVPPRLPPRRMRIEWD